MNGDEKGNRFIYLDHLLEAENFGQNQNNSALKSNVATLILTAISNLQLSLNSIIVQMSAFCYAMRKDSKEIYELMQIGRMISEYVNRRIQLDQYRSTPMGIDLKVSVQMEEAIRVLSLQLAEKGNEYLEDAIAEYERILETQGGLN